MNRNAIDFSERMEQGNANALDYRNQGRGGTVRVFKTTAEMYRNQTFDCWDVLRAEVKATCKLVLAEIDGSRLNKILGDDDGLSF